MKFGCLIAPVLILLVSVTSAEEPHARTSLADTSIGYTVPDKPYAILKAGQVTAVVVNNQAVDDEVLPGHRPGYNGIGALSHTSQSQNLFVPMHSGLNLEFIHDGTNQGRKVLFGPRNVPMELRILDERTAELYQKFSLHYGLESCTRYSLLPDGTLEMIFECIPRQDTFQHDYIGLFWASYIRQPESLDIHFKGFGKNEPANPHWIRGATPIHGKLATHLGAGDQRQFVHADDFPTTLVFSESNYYYSEPWYYGVSHGMALVLMFRPDDQVRFTQSPNGGGKGDPAWDFQFYISDYEIDKRYQLVLRAMYVPFESKEQIERMSAPHRLALGQ